MPPLLYGNTRDVKMTVRYASPVAEILPAANASTKSPTIIRYTRRFQDAGHFTSPVLIPIIVARQIRLTKISPAASLIASTSDLREPLSFNHPRPFFIQTYPEPTNAWHFPCALDLLQRINQVEQANSLWTHGASFLHEIAWTQRLHFPYLQ